MAVDIYKDTWPLAKYMNWYIPASVRDAKGISIGDATSSSRQWPTQDEFELLNPDQAALLDDDSTGLNTPSRANTPRPKSRGRNDDLESTFANVATTLTSFIKTQNDRVDTETVASEQKKLKFQQMYEELDKVLDTANFLEAVKFLTETLERAIAKFQPFTD